MARLHSLTGAAAVSHDGKTYKPEKDGSFEFDDEVARELHGYHVKGKPLWETDEERQQREGAEELARMRDPASLYRAVENIVRAAQGSQGDSGDDARPARTRRSATK